MNWDELVAVRRTRQASDGATPIAAPTATGKATRYIEEVLAKAPPLSEEQVATLVRILRP